MARLLAKEAQLTTKTHTGRKGKNQEGGEANKPKIVSRTEIGGPRRDREKGLWMFHGTTRERGGGEEKRKKEERKKGVCHGHKSLSRTNGGI